MNQIKLNGDLPLMISSAINAQSSQVSFGQKFKQVDADTLKAAVERFIGEDNTEAAINYLTIQFKQGNPNVAALGESYSGLVSQAMVRSTQGNKAPYQR